MRDDEDRDFDGDQPTPPVRAISRGESRSGAIRQSPAPLTLHPFTDDYALFTSGPDDDVRAIIEAIGLDPDLPATRGMVYAVHASHKRHLESHAGMLGQLDTRMDRSDRRDSRRVKRATKLFWAALSSFLLSLGVLASAIWNRAAQEAEARVRAEQTRKDVDDLREQYQHQVELQRAEVERLREEVFRRASHREPQSLVPGNRADDSALAKGIVP